MIRIGVAMLLLAWAAPGTAAPPLYAITRIGSQIDDDARVGAKHAGLMCIPAGQIRWSDVASGTVADRREIVQDAAEEAGLAVTPLGESGGGAGRAPLRLRGVVRAAGFDLCARRWGMGGAGAFSGAARLEVEWHVEDRGGSERPHVSQVSREIAKDRATSLGAIYRALLGDATRDIAHWLIANPG